MPRRSPPSLDAATRPRFIEPMACHAVKSLPEAEGWLCEVKFDGYRVLIIRDGKNVELRSRANRDLSKMFPQIASEALLIRAEQVVIDGELVALDETGRPSFQALQHRARSPGHQLVYYAFDVLHTDGIDLLSWPLEERRAKLTELVPLVTSRLRISQDLPGTPTEILAAVAKVGLEGVVAKRLGSPYTPGERSNAWVKMKLAYSA